MEAAEQVYKIITSSGRKNVNNIYQNHNILDKLSEKLKLLIVPEISDTINSILCKHKIDVEVNGHVDFTVNYKSRLLKWNRPSPSVLLPEDRISRHLEITSFKQTDISQTIYHYLPRLEYADEIIKTGHIRLYNLSKYLKGKGDKKEYRLFLDLFGINFPIFEEQIDSIKKDIFIWCTTTVPNSKKHWEKFSDHGNGICMAVKFNYLNSFHNTIELRNVCYEIPFLSEIQHVLKDKYDVGLEIRGWPRFAKNFKSKEHQWECETRLSFDNKFWKIDKVMQDSLKYENPLNAELNNIFEVKTDLNIGDKYISVPIKNQFFEIDIIKVLKFGDAF